MATVTVLGRGRLVDFSASERRQGIINVTGATLGTATPNANQFDHNLGFLPSYVDIQAIGGAGAAGGWSLTQAWDSTSIYVTIASGGASTGIIQYQE